MNDASEESSNAIGVRWPELLVALFLMALAGLVLADSLRVGIGWADDGPRSGYFPFYIGLALLGASGWTAFKQLRRWRVREVFAERAQLASVMAILLPMVVYVGGIALAGHLRGFGGADCLLHGPARPTRAGADGRGGGGRAGVLLSGVRALVPGAFAQGLA
jgi:hypothetical protein